MVKKEDVASGSNTGSGSDQQEQFTCSPPEAGIAASPAFGSIRYFTKPLNERDDASISSSLLEFERLEKQIGHSGSSSVDTSDKDSYGGSYDERKHLQFTSGSSYDEKKYECGSLDDKKLQRYKRDMERDNLSTTSSLSEFEKLERQIDQQGSNSSVEDNKLTVESKSSSGGKSGSGSGSGSVAGSVSSLTEFEKLEAELAADSPERRSSADSSSSSLQKRSEASSLASLNEFERLERDVVINTELEAEAQKIVSYLEAGSLESGHMFGYSSSVGSVGSVGFSGSDLSDIEAAVKRETERAERDIERDSLSDEEEKGELDSLEGDTSEMTEMVSSVIFAGPAEPAASAQIGLMPGDIDADSLAGECIMQLSSDSLTLHQHMRTSDSSRFDTDSLQEQDDAMVRSVDSLELEKHSDKCDQDSLQEEVMHTSADSLELVQVADELPPENFMLISVESAHWSMGSSGGTMCRSEESHTDSHDFMQVSAESIEDMKISHIEQSTTSTSRSQVIEESIQEGASVTVLYKQSGLVRTETSTHRESSGGGYSEEEEEEARKESPFLQWGPYTEKKKVYTMVEWEALKKEKQQEREERSSSSASPPLAEGEEGGTLTIVLTSFLSSSSLFLLLTVPIYVHHQPCS
jgi:hypothetical protein